MTTATHTTTPDLQALARDAERRLVELREQRARLSLDALTDPEGAEGQELASVESETAAAERQLAHARLAGEERDRRESEAREHAEREQRQQGYERAQALQRDREAAAGKIDRGAKALAGALAVFDCVVREQDEALKQAGRREGTRVRPDAIESAVHAALQAAGVQRGALPLELRFHPRPQALLDGDQKPVEPAEKGAR